MKIKPVRHVAFVKMTIVFYLKPILPCRLADVLSLPGRVLLIKKNLLRSTGLFQGLDRSIFSRTTLVDNDFHVLVQDLDLL